MLLGVGNLGYKLSVCKYFCPLSITSAHTLARSLHDVSRETTTALWLLFALG